MKVEHYYKPDSKTLREEPQVFTRWVDPTIKQLQQENEQLKERIDKAVEFINNAIKTAEYNKEYEIEDILISSKKMLEILKGENNNGNNR